MTAYVIAAPKFDWYQPTWQVFFQKPFFDAENMVPLVVCRSLPWVLHGTTSLS